MRKTPGRRSSSVARTLFGFWDSFVFGAVGAVLLTVDGSL